MQVRRTVKLWTEGHSEEWSLTLTDEDLGTLTVDSTQFVMDWMTKIIDAQIVKDGMLPPGRSND